MILKVGGVGSWQGQREAVWSLRQKDPGDQRIRARGGCKLKSLALKL